MQKYAHYIVLCSLRTSGLYNVPLLVLIQTDSVSGEFISPYMYESFMNTKYLITCSKKIKYKLET